MIMHFRLFLRNFAAEKCFTFVWLRQSIKKNQLITP